MLRDTFANVRTWVFDLDHTLYPPRMGLFDQIESRMTAYVVRELGVSVAAANDMRKRYWATYGTTLAGLMRVHGIAPDPFLDEVHDIDFTVLDPDPDLAVALAALPGRRIVYTNGCAPYAREVIAARGLSGLFDAIYGIEHANYRPKPVAEAFDQVFAIDGFDKTQAAMFEDDPRNLKVPFDMGLKTVLVEDDDADTVGGGHIQHQTSDLSGFLKQLLG